MPVPPNTNPPKKKILLVDDNEAIRIYFQDVFWIHGLEKHYDIIAANSIKKAEEIIKNPETRPDIIFLDLVMPFEKDGKIETTAEAGLSLLERIKKDPELKKIMVVVFSSFDESSYKEKAKKLGADQYLVKGDALPQDILAFIEKHIR